MEKQTGVRFGEPYLWRVLKRMNFRLKKVAPVRRDKPA